MRSSRSVIVTLVVLLLFGSPFIIYVLITDSDRMQGQSWTDWRPARGQSYCTNTPLVLALYTSTCTSILLKSNPTFSGLWTRTKPVYLWSCSRMAEVARSSFLLTFMAVHVRPHVRYRPGRTIKNLNNSWTDFRPARGQKHCNNTS